jgi:ribosomal protein S18 acetylase RimI-like enzyme
VTPHILPVRTADDLAAAISLFRACAGSLGVDCCEMKRLYVAPEARGTGLGTRLVEAVVAEAERRGYREMRLDTLPSMTTAQALYRALGFEPMEPYYHTPVAGTVFMHRRLGMRPPAHSG